MQRHRAANKTPSLACCLVLALTIAHAAFAASGSNAAPKTLDAWLRHAPNRLVAQYTGTWSDLPTAASVVPRNLRERVFVEVQGEQAKRTYRGQSVVEIRDVALAVRWAGGAKKYATTLFHVDGASRVVIENVSIVLLDADARTYDTIHIENSDDIVIRNVYIAGSASGYHIRIENPVKAILSEVEIAGRDYGTGGHRGGGGIWIRGGPPSSGERIPTWIQLQNCFMHHYTDADELRNHDAVNIESPGNGLMFNCEVREWGREGKAGDAAADISFRHAEGPGGAVFRVERNVFRQSFLTKTPATGGKSNAVAWVNNVYEDTQVADYHGGYANRILHNTFVLNQARRFYRIWEMVAGGQTVFRNNHILAAARPHELFYQNEKGVANKLAFLDANYNSYVMPRPHVWLAGAREKAASFLAWRSLGKDLNSVLLEDPTCGQRVVARVAEPLERPWAVEDCMASLRGDSGYVGTSDVRLRVSRDFRGVKRRSPPRVGAFE